MDSGLVFAPGQRLTDAAVDALAGGSVAFYQAGTSTPLVVYSDPGLQVALGIVVYLDSGGYPVASQGSSAKVSVYTGAALVKAVFRKANGVIIATKDNLRCSQDTSAFLISTDLLIPSEALAETTYVVTDADYGKHKRFSTSGGNLNIALPAASGVTNGRTLFVSKDGAANVITFLPDGSDTVGGESTFQITGDQSSVTLLCNGTDAWSIIGFYRKEALTGPIRPQIGAIEALSHDDPDPGWSECDGAAISRTTYADLFAKIGIKHGEGDGSTTFNKPDYRGRTLRGWDHDAGRDPDAGSRTAANTGGATGDNVGSVQEDEIKEHAHPTTKPVHTGIDYGGSGLGANVMHAPTPQFTDSGDAGGAETRGKNAAVMFVIFTGVFS